MNNVIENATLAQNRAAEPDVSTFVSANAGSGKTTVLTNRIARLLIHGADPRRILCLTFTKAAAGEVQNRVYERLGEWVLLPDADLSIALNEIGETQTDAQSLRRARRLFAQAIESAGGLKIQTIHAFCAHVLRRFPLEAGVSPNFREMSESDQKIMINTAYEQVVLGDPEQYRNLTNWFSFSDFTDAFLAVRSHISAQLSDAQFNTLLGIPAPDADALRVFDHFDQAFHDMLLDKATEKESPPIGQYKIAKDAPERIHAMRSILLTQKGTPTKKYENRAQKEPDFDQKYQIHLEAIAAVAHDEMRGKIAQINQFLNQVNNEYIRQKTSGGLLDYDDLIEKTQALLAENQGLSWVMYRLDGGIDHILVDEAQDNSAAQWQIIDAIAKGAEETDDRLRTLFVVGDHKQSIFAFQGASPDIFTAKSGEYSTLKSGHGGAFVEQDLQVSFRSSPLILDFVDQFYRGDSQAGLGQTISHSAGFDQLPGRIEIWPYLFKTKGETPVHWPIHQTDVSGQEVRSLAQRIAINIAEEIRSGQLIQHKGKNRPVTPSDYLILLRKRSEFFYEVQRALIMQNVPIAGVDRFTLNTELAAQDVIALLRFAASPFDDLSLACFLRSPIAGLSEADLYHIATSRGDDSLFDALMSADDYHEAKACVEFARDGAHHLRPYDLIYQLLYEYGCEAKLRARLGEAAEDVLASLLETSMRYETEENPSLEGFLAWYDRQDIKVKRDFSETANAVRVMTIHGAKGLEAPIVYLPHIESKDKPPPSLSEVENIVVPRRIMGDGFAQAIPLKLAKDRENSSTTEEKNRLGYVALTRAASKLVIMGLGVRDQKTKTWPEGHIYPQFIQALEDMPGEIEVVSTPDGEILRKSQNWLDHGQASQSTQPMSDRLILPVLKHSETSRIQKSVSEVIASYEGETHGRGPEFGDEIHGLLAALPKMPREKWRDYFANVNLQHPEALDEAITVLETIPDLMGSHWLREFDFEFQKQTHVIRGRIDAASLDDGIELVDYKSNQTTYDHFDQLPMAYQQQMAIYARALLQVKPDAQMRARLIWTVNASALEIGCDQLLAVKLPF